VVAPPIDDYDSKTEQFQEWKMPTPYSMPYDAIYDDREYAWTGGMGNDHVSRLDTRTGEVIDFLLPSKTNIRRVDVDRSVNPSHLWIGNNHGATIIKVKPPTQVISLEAAKKSYDGFDGSTLAKRVAHVMQASFAGKRVVVFSGGEAKGLEGVYEEVRGIRDGGGNGSIIGRNTFQRPKAEALAMLDKIIEIYQGKA